METIRIFILVFIAIGFLTTHLLVKNIQVKRIAFIAIMVTTMLLDIMVGYYFLARLWFVGILFMHSYWRREHNANKA